MIGKRKFKVSSERSEKSGVPHNAEGIRLYMQLAGCNTCDQRKGKGDALRLHSENRWS